MASVEKKSLFSSIASPFKSLFSTKSGSLRNPIRVPSRRTPINILGSKAGAQQAPQQTLRQPRTPVRSAFPEGTPRQNANPFLGRNQPTGTQSPFFQGTPTVPQVRDQAPSPRLPAAPTGFQEPEAPRPDPRFKRDDEAPQLPKAPKTTSQEDVVAEAEKALAKSQLISKEELSTQKDLDKLITATSQAFTGTQDKPIPLEFITGQLQSIENRALNLAQPLNAQLARQQAARTASIESSKFALERADKKLKASQAEGEAFTLGKEQVRFDAAGNIIAQGGGLAGGVDTSQVTAFADAISNNTAKLSDVPQDIRASVLAEIESQKGATTTPQQRRALDQAGLALDTLNDIFENPALDRGAINRGIFKILPGTDSRDLNKAVQSIQALIGFDELDKMRQASPTGGALGQISEREIDFLQALKGSIDTSQSDEVLRNNLERVQRSFQILQLTSSLDGASGEIDGITFLKQGDDLITQTQDGAFRLNERGNLEPIEDFKPVGGDTNKASKLADAIMTVESGGKQIKGASGEFGAFQFIPATWAIISKEIAGQVIPQTAENERFIAEQKINQLLEKGHTPKEVALIWNTSLGGAEKPFVRKGTNKSGVNFDSGAYASKVVNTLNKLT